MEPCADCEKILAENIDHPNPEGLHEWYNSGHHICGRSLSPQLVSDKINPKVLEVRAEATNGLKITWEGVHKCSIESKDKDGNWQPIKYVKNAKILIGVDYQLPEVTLEYYILDVGSKSL